MKVLIVCSGGISSSILINTLEKEAQKNGNEFVAFAIGYADLDNEINNGYDIVLIAPQVRYKFDSIKKIADEKNVKSYQIQASEYTPIGAINLFKTIVKILGE